MTLDKVTSGLATGPRPLIRFGLRTNGTRGSGVASRRCFQAGLRVQSPRALTAFADLSLIYSAASVAGWAREFQLDR